MKRYISNLALFILTLAVALSLSSPATAEDPARADGKIVILHTNDVHCKIDQVISDGAIINIGYAGVAAYKAEMEGIYGAGNVTLVDGGDAVSGGVIGSLSNGRSIVEIMNMVGYDVAVPGNHEFDYKIPAMLTLINEVAEFPYVSSNFIDLKTGESVLDAYQIIRYGEVSIAYVGICTPEAVRIGAMMFQDENGHNIYSLCQDSDGQALYDNIQKSVDAARAEGADYVVALGHLGTNGIDPRWQAETAIKNTSGIDVFIDGHSHEQYEKEILDKDGESVVLAQAGTALAAIGKIVIDTETGEIAHELISGYGEQDPEVLSCVEKTYAEHNEQLKQPICTTNFPLTVNDVATWDRAVRSGETNLGDLTTDAYRIMLSTDIGITNSGMIRASIDAGAVTSGDLMTALPATGPVCVFEATGQQIYEALEMGSRNCPEESGGFLQVSGLEYTIDCSVPSPVVTDDDGLFERVEGPARVKNVLVGGAPLDPAKIYTVATNTYITKYGVDGFTNFKSCNIVSEGRTTLEQAVIDYVNTLPGGTVGEEYRNPYGQGRITVLHSNTQLPEWYEAVRYVIESGFMSSPSSTGSFVPDGEVTCAGVLQVFYNIEGRPDAEDDAERWYTNAANWAVKVGLTSKFAEDYVITRGEVKALLDSYGELKSIDTSGLMANGADGDMVLAEILTRADFAQILFNLSKSLYT